MRLACQRWYKVMSIIIINNVNVVQILQILIAWSHCIKYFYYNTMIKIFKIVLKCDFSKWSVGKSAMSCFNVILNSWKF